MHNRILFPLASVSILIGCNVDPGNSSGESASSISHEFSADNVAYNCVADPAGIEWWSMRNVTHRSGRVKAGSWIRGHSYVVVCKRDLECESAKWTIRPTCPEGEVSNCPARAAFRVEQTWEHQTRWVGDFPPNDIVAAMFCERHLEYGPSRTENTCRAALTQANAGRVDDPTNVAYDWVIPGACTAARRDAPEGDVDGLEKMDLDAPATLRD